MRAERYFAGCALLLFVAPLARAQEKAGAKPEGASLERAVHSGREELPAVNAEQDRRLWMGGRELLHAGIPVELFGREEGDNGFRDGAPALERSDRQVARVDREELRAQRLAMYSEGALFTRPPTRHGRVDATRGTDRNAPPPSEPSAAGGNERTERASGWTGPLALGVFVLATGVWLRRRFRPRAL